MLASKTSHCHLNLKESCIRSLLLRDHGSISGLILSVIFLPVQKHLLFTVCYLSKYVVVRPLKSKTTNEVIENLKDFYLDVGVPDIIQHDQGKELTINQRCNSNLNAAESLTSKSSP